MLRESWEAAGGKRLAGVGQTQASESINSCSKRLVTARERAWARESNTELSASRSHLHDGPLSRAARVAMEETETDAIADLTQSAQARLRRTRSVQASAARVHQPQRVKGCGTLETGPGGVSVPLSLPVLLVVRRSPLHH